MFYAHRRGRRSWCSEHISGDVLRVLSACYFCNWSPLENVCSSDNIFTLSEKAAICPSPSVTFPSQKVICSSGLAACVCRHDGRVLPAVGSGRGRGDAVLSHSCGCGARGGECAPSQEQNREAGREQPSSRREGASPPLWFSAVSSLPAFGSQLRQGCWQGALGTHPAPHSPPILSPPRSEAPPR